MAPEGKKKILFVDDDPNILNGLKRMLRRMSTEWDMVFVESGAEALEYMKRNPIDVVVSDMKMPGMDGAHLLEQAMNEHPEVVRIVLSGYSDKETVLKSVQVAQQYLSKPCDPDKLRATIERACALRNILTNHSLKRVISQISSLPSLPELYQEILEELHSIEPSIQKIGDIIEKDVAMTAKILQLVNSAFFGMPRHIGSPHQAVTLLGLETVKALVLSVKVFSQFEETKVPRKFFDTLWKHSMKTGRLVREIVKVEKVEKEIAEDSYMAALLHDVGKLVLAASFPEDYREIIGVSLLKKAPIRTTEQEKFGTTHAEVGAYLMGIWGLPDNIIEALAFHHRPAKCPVNRFAPLTAVHVASAIEHQCDPRNEIDYSGEVDLDHLARLGVAERFEVWKRLSIE